MGDVVSLDVVHEPLFDESLLLVGDRHGQGSSSLHEGLVNPFVLRQGGSVLVDVLNTGLSGMKKRLKQMT